MEKYVVTLSRLCGCGGKQIGEILAKRLSVPLYDKNLLRRASDDSGISEDLFLKADERMPNNRLFRISRRVYDGSVIKPSSGDFTSDRNLFNYQAKVLRELADEESYVVIGRCADFILKDKPHVIRIFLTADIETCIKREQDRYGITEKEAAAKCVKKNKERSDYYRFYTEQTWSHAGNYDLCINSTYLSYEECADLIIDYMKRRLPFLREV